MRRKGQAPLGSGGDSPAPPVDARDAAAAATAAPAGGAKAGSPDALLQSIRDKVREAYERVGSTAGRFHFRPPPGAAEIQRRPMVTFLGNHSAGKSSFINYILSASAGTPVSYQRTGVAPVDDGFTLLMGGETFSEQTGPAVVNNTSLPFTALSQFGEDFVNRLRLKVAPVPLLRDVVLVDSPGMIDSADTSLDRGYDFIKAVRYFADKSDFVLICFDVNNPGSTGESITVFTKALSGIEHKLLIILNKVDVFTTVSDFSRTTAALAWNLSKVIKIKDLPWIYSTYVPQAEGPGAAAAAAASRAWSLAEFDKNREEIISKIRNAPSRHVDNMTTELRQYTLELTMHVKVIAAARRQLFWYRLFAWLAVLALVACACALTWVLGGQDAVRTAAAALAVVPLGLYALWSVRAQEQGIVRGLTETFERVYANVLLDKDHRDDVLRLWELTSAPIRTAVARHGLMSFPAVRQAELDAINDVLHAVVPGCLDQIHRHIRSKAK